MSIRPLIIILKHFAPQDSATVIKDLKDGDHDIDRKIEGIGARQSKSECVKKT